MSYAPDVAVIHAAGFTDLARAAGFIARTLPGGYAGTALPAGCTAYLARRR